MNAVNRQPSPPNASAERAFAYLDGELDAEEHSAFEADAKRDPALAAELAAARAFLRAMGTLRELSPSPDFAVRTMARFRLPASPWARFWSWMAGSDHGVARNPLAALVEGELSRRQAAWMTAYVASDPKAAASLAAWKRLHQRLERLPALEPAPGFPFRVMARVPAARVRAPAARSLAGRSWAAAVADWTTKALPRRQERLAAASGVAFGPVAAVAAVAWVVFSNPMVTFSVVAAFATAKVAAVFGLAGAFVGDLATSTARSWTAGLWNSGSQGLLDGATAAAPTVAAGLAAFAALSLASAWVLYKNVKVWGTERLHAPA